MKTKIFVESCGRDVKVRLAKDQDQIAHNMFANLAWACKERRLPEESGNFSMFMAERNKFKRLLKTFKSLLGEEAFEVYTVPRSDVQVYDARPHIYTVRAGTFQRLQNMIGEGYEG